MFFVFKPFFFLKLVFSLFQLLFKNHTFCTKKKIIRKNCSQWYRFLSPSGDVLTRVRYELIPLKLQKLLNIMYLTILEKNILNPVYLRRIGLMNSSEQKSNLRCSGFFCHSKPNSFALSGFLVRFQYNVLQFTVTSDL